MVYRTVLICLLCFMCSPIWASGLPPVHEAARLNLAIETAVKNQEWSKAHDLLKQMRALKTKQPLNSLYYEGLVLSKINKYDDSVRILERYVVEGGSGVTYYKEALNLITDAQESKSNTVIEQPVLSQLSLANDAETSRDTYLDSLRSLYLVDDAAEAIVLEVNSLLHSHPYTGKRVKGQGVLEGRLFKIEIKKPNIIVQEKDFQAGLPTLKVDKLSVLGVNPFVETKCLKSDLICWLVNPATEHGRWIVFDYDLIVANELSKAFSALIRLLQDS